MSWRYREGHRWPGARDGHGLACVKYMGAVNGGLEGLRIYPSNGEPFLGLGQAPDLRLAFREINLVSVEEQEEVG